ncbi:hypothetical protein AK830_g493 [Neonectria ditissima]|uniref:Enoyl reductase (ER) domain-containing protein n=1 Tax=Neonectria ditissima TaxID=78410 RepID=A0A0P7BY47_9HYPO|nr:hypothetical protein AK830_g493 [Neonectria ditissima]
MSMLAIQAPEGGKPKAVQVSPPAAPADDSTIQVRVLAAGLHQVVRSRTSGKHYSVENKPATTQGVDGTGINISTGKAVYFHTLATGDGTFAELVNVPARDAVELPEDVDPVQAAALANPVLSSWMALRKRAGPLREGWTCLILGVTGTSGQLAIKVAKTMGASKIIGAGRNEETLKRLDLDEYIVLRDPASSTDFSAAATVDVVLDYVYGPYVHAYLSTTRSRTPLTWVGIGAMAGHEATFPSQALRRRDVTVRGAGLGSWSKGDLSTELPGIIGVLKGVKMGGLREVGMADAEEGWAIQGERVVFVNKVKGE